jgi:predicted nucleotidyltransferase
MLPSGPIPEKFTAALDALVGQVRQDRSVLAAILCGSLSHDTVWAKSDIDLVLVTIDDRQVESAKERGVSLYEDEVNIHAMLITRAEFRRTVEGAVHQSFPHAFLAKGRLLYTHDPTIADLFSRLRDLGDRDMRLQRLRAATAALAPINKAHKWFVTRGDLEYAALWILYAATPLAEIELLSRRRLVGREVIPEALALNPPFFAVVYTDLLNQPKTRDRVARALDAVDAYVADRAPSLFAPILDHLREVGEARSAREIEHHLRRQGNVGDMTTACEYLARQSLIGKASIPARLTKRSTVQVQELAFYALDDRP